MTKQWFGRAAILLCVCLGATQVSFAKDLRLVGNEVEAFISDTGDVSRLTDLVSAALKDTPHVITATTQAWSGSGLRNGRFDGYVDHYSLNEPERNYVYSTPYVQLYLHVASTRARAVDINRLDQLNRERVGLEIRFANTDQVRSERSVSWARTQDFFSNVKQLAERRVDYIVADKITLKEFNKLLIAVDREPLYLSARPLFTVGVSLGIHTDYPAVDDVLKEFEAGIQALQSTNEYDDIYTPADEAASILDASLYEELLKRW